MSNVLFLNTKFYLNAIAKQTGYKWHILIFIRMIKMTSPNLNIVMIIGTIMGYITVILLGLDTSHVHKLTIEGALQATQFLLVFGFSFIYGSLMAKTWRVYLIFKNLNVNGKVRKMPLTRSA